MPYKAVQCNGVWHVSNSDHGHPTAENLSEEKARSMAAFLNEMAGEPCGSDIPPVICDGTVSWWEDRYDRLLGE